ncbi:hypothetical protein Trydic_g14797 [Trypoxylus dichotomus]
MQDQSLCEYFRIVSGTNVTVADWSGSAHEGQGEKPGKENEKGDPTRGDAGWRWRYAGAERVMRKGEEDGWCAVYIEEEACRAQAREHGPGRNI